MHNSQRPFKYLCPFFPLPSVSQREEITTLSRQASFRRMNSVSTDTRGAVLLLNYSFHTEHTVLLQHHLVFSPMSCAT